MCERVDGVRAGARGCGRASDLLDDEELSGVEVHGEVDTAVTPAANEVAALPAADAADLAHLGGVDGRQRLEQHVLLAHGGGGEERAGGGGGAG
jgi:hypothetical protein